MMLRELFLLSVAILGTVDYAEGQPFVYQYLPSLGGRIRDACGFLSSLYNPALGLVRETEESTVYYIASDNLLAQKAIESCNPDAARSIRSTLANCCENGNSKMHEVLLDTPIELPIHTATIRTVANSSSGFLFNGIQPSVSGEYNIMWEIHNGTGTLSPTAYADVAAYTGLEYERRGNRTGVSEMMENLNIMFDGEGLVDEPYQNGTTIEHGTYQTLKLALYINLMRREGIPVYPGLLERLLRMQDADGGFRTGYDQAGTYAGTLANVETTSTVLLTLNLLASHQQQPLRFPFVPWWPYPFSLFLILGILAGVGATAIFIYRDERRRRDRLRAQ